MSLTPGTRLGFYEVVAKLGEGGMGEVYRALDVRLNRQVALKVLPAALAGDPGRLHRLQREARVLASLNHPHIATLHGLEESNGTFALVMELVEGEDLRQRLARGRIPLDEAMRIARQIALGLEAAHAQGIVHRDLKPANIKVRADGTVKVLDFGLAKTDEADALNRVAGESPTLTAAAALTTPGEVIGTAAYMSPEQARGLPADKRSDIWAFGCVLFRMLTGRMAFPGNTLTDTLAAVLRGEPDWAALPDTTPPGLRLLIRRCLEKDPTRRLHDIADARIEIDDATSGARSIETAPPARAARWRFGSTAGLVAVALALGAVAGWAVRRVPVLPETRVEISTPSTADMSFALSPDGRRIAFVAPDNGLPRLWVRSLDNPIARPLAGTERATMPFWEPDGEAVGFYADTKIKRVNLEGGAVLTMASDITRVDGAAWGRDGSILYGTAPFVIRRIAAPGAVAVDVTRREANERAHSFPQFLPGRRRFIFFVEGDPEIQGVYLGELDGGRKTRLFEADGAAVYAEPGYLVFVRSGRVLAQRFDPGSGTLSGNVLTLGDASGPHRLSASSAGTLGYRTLESENGQRQILWVDRSGHEIKHVDYAAGSAAQAPALSHDGRFVAVQRMLNGNADLWQYDWQRESLDRLTFDPGDDWFPVWSHDDRSIIYSAIRNAAPLSLYKRLMSAPPEDEQLLFKTTELERPAVANDWSADGKFLLFTLRRPKRGTDILALSIADAAAKPFDVVATAANETAAEFSPDGKWIAYQSDKDGDDEIFIRPFPGPGPDSRVSPNGGVQPRWNPMGRELFYIGSDGAMMAVSIVLRPDGTADTDRPHALFPSGIGSPRRPRPEYCVSSDGNSFVINSIVNAPLAQPIQLVLNWKPGR